MNRWLWVGVLMLVASAGVAGGCGEDEDPKRSDALPTLADLEGDVRDSPGLQGQCPGTPTVQIDGASEFDNDVSVFQTAGRFKTVRGSVSPPDATVSVDRRTEVGDITDDAHFQAFAKPEIDQAGRFSVELTRKAPYLVEGKEAQYRIRAQCPRSGEQGIPHTVGISGPETAEPSKKASSHPRWTTVRSFSGNGAEKTAPFSVGDSDYRLVYRFSPGQYGGVLGVFLYTVDGESQDVVVNTSKPGQSSTRLYGLTRGTRYYFDVNATDDWVLTVQALK